MIQQTLPIKKIFAGFAALFVAMAVVCFGIVVSQGENLQYIHGVKPGTLTIDIAVEQGAADLVQVEAEDLSDGAMCLHVRSLGNGEGQATVTAAWVLDLEDDQVEASVTMDVNVLPFGVVAVDGGYAGGAFALLLMAIWLMALSVVLALIFKRRRKSGLLSAYRSVAVLGMFFFTNSSAVMLLIQFSLVSLNSSYSIANFLVSLADLGVFFMVLAIPVFALMAVFVALSNVSLLRHEGVRPTNMLGFAANVAILLGYIALMFVPTSGGESILLSLGEGAEVVIAYAVSYVECMLLATMICSYMANGPFGGGISYDRDFIIILGCAIRSDGTPTPLLQGRIDRALKHAKEQEEKTGEQLRFVCSGGQGSDEVISEALCMKNYLLSKGVAEDRILLEDKSTNTLENMRFSKAIIDACWNQADSPKIMYSTTNYHVFRAGMFALQADMMAQGIGAGTKWYFWPNAWLREFVGFMVSSRKLAALVMASLVAWGVLVHVMAKLLLG